MVEALHRGTVRPSLIAPGTLYNGNVSKKVMIKFVYAYRYRCTKTIKEADTHKLGHHM